MSDPDLPTDDMPDHAPDGPDASPGASGGTPPPRPDSAAGGPTPPSGYGPEYAGQWSAPRSQRRPAAAFFNSVHSSGMVRTEQRWIGGVAGGVARRLGIDVTLVRCVWIVTAIFFTGLALILYGLGWALLPEESDGRIHAEQALGGDVTAGLAGSIVVLIAGMSSTDHGLGWYGDVGFPRFLSAAWALLWIGVVVAGIIWLVHSRRSSYQGARPETGPAWTPPTAPEAPGAQNWSTAPNAQAGPGSAPATAFAPETTGESQGPSAGARGRRNAGTARPRIPGPGRTTSLCVLGLGLIALAAIGLARKTQEIGLFQSVFLAAGAALLLLAVGIIACALRGRRGGWMTGLGWPLLLIMGLPLLAFGSLLPPQAASAPIAWAPVDITLSNDDLDPATTHYPVLPDGTIDLGSYAAGSVTVDMSRVTWDANGDKNAAVRVVMGAGRILVKTSEGQPVRVAGHAEAGAFETELSSSWTTPTSSRSEYLLGRTYTADGAELPISNVWWPLTHRREEAVSPSAEDRRGLIDVDAQVGAGAIQVEEASSQVTWTGSVESSTWVVGSWTDADGGKHSDNELPVPGMTHPAVDSDTADECLDRVTEDDRPPHTTRWWDLSDLSASTRSAYEGCLVSAWEHSGRDGAAATPAPTPSSTPGATRSATPSPAPTH